MYNKQCVALCVRGGRSGELLGGSGEFRRSHFHQCRRTWTSHKLLRSLSTLEQLRAQFHVTVFSTSVTPDRQMSTVL